MVTTHVVIPTLLKVSNLTCLPLLSIHTRNRCHVANGNVTTNNQQRMTNYGKLGEPSHCLPLSSADNGTAMWDNNNTGQQQHGEDTIISPPTTMTTSQLLLPCQLTCALHTWSINIAHDPWMYPLWVFNPMYTLTGTHRLLWPMSRVQAFGR